MYIDDLSNLVLGFVQFADDDDDDDDNEEEEESNVQKTARRPGECHVIHFSRDS